MAHELSGHSEVRGRPRPGINFFASISGNMGLGVAARNWLRFLLDAGFPVHAVEVPDRAGRDGHDLRFRPISHGLDEPAPHGVNLFAMNPWSLRRIACGRHRAFRLHDRVNAILPFWELPQLPEDWRPELAAMDLVIAPSRYVGRTFRAARLAAEVVDLPQPFEPDAVAARGRASWGVPDDAFLVAAGFAPASDVERKNPWALVDAFQRAFPRDPRARLVLKLNDPCRSERDREPVEHLARRCAHDPRIRLVDEVLPYSDVLALWAVADVYVSLHRAEGLGLGMLEAMSVGTPVVATGWSGNLDYMDADSAFLVDAKLVPVRAANQPAYTPEVVGADARWAEPDVAQAAEWLRRLAEDPALGRERAERALHRLAERRARTRPETLAAALRRAARSPAFQHRAARPSREAAAPRAAATSRLSPPRPPG